jgi:hypothetical protein
MLRALVFEERSAIDLQNVLDGWFQREGLGPDRLIRLEYTVAISRYADGTTNDYSPIRSYSAVVVYMERR